MSLNRKCDSCVRCHAYLFEEDDVVYCPICGAPHHRECYNQIGHCALEKLHGTENEYSLKKQEEIQNAEKEDNDNDKIHTDNAGMVKCSMCDEIYDYRLQKCPKCNTLNLSGNTSFNGFDLLGGIPADFVIDDNVSADDVKRFVMANPHKYVPKFVSLNKQNKASWNWMAFLFPCPWMLARKMYKNGIITGFLTVIASLLTLPMQISLFNSGVISQSYSELFKSIGDISPNINLGIIIAFFIGLILELILRIVSGIFSDYWYKNYVVKTIKNIKSDIEDTVMLFRKKGGVNIFLFMLGIMILQYIPNIVLAFIM